MIVKTPTVLVLGAGASAPYGFPLGKELADDVCARLEADKQWEHLLRIGLDEPMIIEFAQALYQSQSDSVDAFVATRHEFTKIGKAVIAHGIASKEDPDALLDRKRDGQNWYKAVFLPMMENPDEFCRDNALSIVTFNYDRSLEQFLFMTMKSKHKMCDGRCADVLRHLRIVHVHGSLGPLPWPVRRLPGEPAPQGIPYERRTDGHGLKECAENILILPEVSGPSRDFEEARRLLFQAARVVFVGFGYHPQNRARLGLDRLGRDKLWGTVHGMGAVARNRLEQLLHPTRMCKGTAMDLFRDRFDIFE